MSRIQRLSVPPFSRPSFDISMKTWHKLNVSGEWTQDCTNVISNDTIKLKQRQFVELWRNKARAIDQRCNELIGSIKSSRDINLESMHAVRAFYNNWRQTVYTLQCTLYSVHPFKQNTNVNVNNVQYMYIVQVIVLAYCTSHSHGIIGGCLCYTRTSISIIYHSG